MKTYAVALVLEIDDDSPLWAPPSEWDFRELVGDEVRAQSVHDITGDDNVKLVIGCDGVRRV